MKLYKDKVLITGSSGFVGQNLVEYLDARAFNIQKLNLRSQSWPMEAATDVSTYIHLAGKAHDTKNTSDKEEYFKINTGLTIDLFKHFIESEAKLFIYMSSVKAVADKVTSELDESMSSRPSSPYGASKWEAEQFILAQNLPPSKRVFILRPCMIHGVGNKGNLNLLYKVVNRGIPYPLGAFDNKRSFLSVDNLCYVIHQIIVNEKVESGVYNVSDDDSIATTELVKIIASSTNQKVKLLQIPKWIIKGCAKVGDFLHLPLNSERLEKMTETFIVSNKKIKKALGIEKFPVSAQDGLANTIQSFNKSK
jgi:nucleoside-diphosphate-sugar epimerase